MATSRRMRRLRARRREAGIDQRTVAQRIAALSGWRIDQPVLSRIESGAFPAPSGFLRYYEGALRDG